MSTNQQTETTDRPLSWVTVTLIRNGLAHGMPHEAAALLYGISEETVRAIENREVYTDNPFAELETAQ